MSKSPPTSKKHGRASLGASRSSTPKVPKSVTGGGSTSARKRKARAPVDGEPASKRSGRGRATAAAASEAIKQAVAKRPRAAPGTKV